MRGQGAWRRSSARRKGVMRGIGMVERVEKVEELKRVSSENLGLLWFFCPLCQRLIDY